METFLWSDPAFGTAGVDGDIKVRVERPSRTTVRFRYDLRGRVDRLAIPPPAAPLRADELWKTTCLEAFLAPEHLTSYLELNFSPSSQWAAYDFAAYRHGMVQAELPMPPEIDVERRSDRLVLTATVSLHLPHERYWLGLAAVVEARDGDKGYFALIHRGPAADFHRRDCFILELPPPEQP